MLHLLDSFSYGLGLLLDSGDFLEIGLDPDGAVAQGFVVGLQ